MAIPAIPAAVVMAAEAHPVIVPPDTVHQAGAHPVVIPLPDAVPPEKTPPAEAPLAEAHPAEEAPVQEAVLPAKKSGPFDNTDGLFFIFKYYKLWLRKM
jgi:hypothetical protein